MSGLFAASGGDDTQLFPSIIGQVRIKKLMRRLLEGNRLSHSYLVVGQEGTGRTALALEIARVLNCDYGIESSVYGCDCHSCKIIKEWHHPNLIPVFPLPAIKDRPDTIDWEALPSILEAKREDSYSRIKLTGLGFIRIAQIRELKNQLSLMQDKSGIRTIIISPAERMNEASSNALMKLLEEPPDKSCILLITDTVRNLLPTIVSRCQTFSLPNLSSDEIEKALVTRSKVSEGIAKPAALLSGGSYTRARIMVNDGIESQVEGALEFLRAAATGNAVNINSRLGLWGWKVDKAEVLQFLSFLTVWLKDALVMQSFSADERNNHISISGQEDIISKIATRYSKSALEQALFEVENSKVNVDTNTNIHLIMIALSIKLHRALN